MISSCLTEDQTYICPSTIKTQMSLVFLLLLGKLGCEVSAENCCSFAKVTYFWEQFPQIFMCEQIPIQIRVSVEVIYPKYSKHWPFTVAHTIDCVCSKMLNHGINHGIFFSLFKLILCPIHWIVCVLPYSNFKFEF